MVEHSDRMWSSGEGNGKPLQYYYLENPKNSMKRQKDRTLKDELPRLVGAHDVTGEGGEITPETMARVNIHILGISELKWTGMGEWNSDDHYIYYCGQESLRRNGVAIMVNKRVRNAILGCNLKNNRIISVCFQGKPFNTTVIQVYAPTTNAEEAEVERFYEALQDQLELIPKKRCPFHYRGLECKSRKSRNTLSNRQIWPWSTERSRAKANRVLPRECTGHSKHPLPTAQEKTLHMDITRWSTPKSD